MNENFATLLALAFVVSGLTVASWLKARRIEREAYYRNEAIKKIADMQGDISGPVLQLLRAALPAAPIEGSIWNPEVTQARYRNDMLTRIAEMGGESERVLQFLKEEEYRAARRQREGLRLASLITGAVGIGLTIFLWLIMPERPVYSVGFIPVLVSFALALASRRSLKE